MGGAYRVPNVDTLECDHTVGVGGESLVALGSEGDQLLIEGVSRAWEMIDMIPRLTRDTSEGKRKPWEYL